MQLVAARRGLGQQVLVIQLVKVATRLVQAGAIERGDSVGVEVRAGNQAEAAKQPLRARGEVLVRQAERGGDRQVLGVHHGQPVSGLG
jgi:hypothetical protein